MIVWQIFLVSIGSEVFMIVFVQTGYFFVAVRIFYFFLFHISWHEELERDIYISVTRPSSHMCQLFDMFYRILLHQMRHRNWLRLMTLLVQSCKWAVHAWQTLTCWYWIFFDFFNIIGQSKIPMLSDEGVWNTELLVYYQPSVHFGWSQSKACSFHTDYL